MYELCARRIVGIIPNIFIILGEHMTEYELSEYLTTLLGYNEEGGSCEQHLFDPTEAGNVIIDNLPVDITTERFTDDLLGFGFYQQPDVLRIDQ